MNQTYHLIVASYPYPYESNGIYDPPATSYYDDYDTSYAVQRQDDRDSHFLQWLTKGKQNYTNGLFLSRISYFKRMKVICSESFLSF